MSADVMEQHRQQVLARARGKVLEVGFGTGLNLPFYPATVEQLTALDTNPGTLAIAERRLAKTTIPVEKVTLNGESLPMVAASFDTVVSTWTLCSIARVSQALNEIHRVLKPDGKFLFIEHGLSPDRSVRVFQNRLNGWQKAIADGCNLNRNIPRLIEDADFEILELESFYAKGLPGFMGYFYKGIAQKR
ncbi:MAG: class I SAM-dependent methyltransferase [Cyanobacteria bacterium J06642_2]